LKNSKSKKPAACSSGGKVKEGKMDGSTIAFWLITFFVIVMLGVFSQFFYGPDNAVEQSVEKMLQKTVDLDIDFSPDY